MGFFLMHALKIIDVHECKGKGCTLLVFSRNMSWWIPHNGLGIMEKYDEDVYENPFFTALQNDYSQLYDEATSLRCTVCHNIFVFAIFIISTTKSCVCFTR